MTATTYPENGILQRDAISLPLLRPVSKPPSATVAPEPATKAAPEPEAAPKPKSPPTVQTVQKLNADLLGAGDKLVVRTANSTYNFEFSSPMHCRVIPSKSSARTGEAVLMGGLSADASEYTPNRISVGGRIAYQFTDEDSAIMSSEIVSIFWVAAPKSA